MKITVRSTSFRLTGWLAITAISLAFAAPAVAQWKWRDKANQVHVSDLPPPADVPEKDILKRPANTKLPEVGAIASAPAASAADAASTPGSNKLEAEADARKAKAEQEEKAKRKATEEANAAIGKDNCARAKRQLTTIDSGIRISRTNDKGEREILDDKGRAEEAQRARSVIAADCK